MKSKAVFLYADYYDATSHIIRLLTSANPVFETIDIVYWARLGRPREKPKDDLYNNTSFICFVSPAPTSKAKVFLKLIKYQWFLLKYLIKTKPSFVTAITFYTILPAIVYKYFYKINSTVFYDPRDYVANTFKFGKFITFILKLIDNVYIKLSDFVLFPDNQYFIHYGLFSLKPDKYLIIPNSTEDSFCEIDKINIFKKYCIPNDKYIIPILGFFNADRGEKILFELIKLKDERLIFIFAGDIRDENYLQFFDDNENVIFLGKIPYKDALAIMNSSLVVPQLYDPALKNNVYAYATKYYDCLMIGTPVVTTDGQINMASEILKNNFGWVINYYDTKALMDVIDNYIKNPNIIDKEKLRTYFKNNYDYSRYKIKLTEIYKNTALKYTN